MNAVTHYAGVELYAQQADALGEGPMWSSAEKALYWLDIARKTLHRQAPTDVQRQSWLLSEYPGCLGELAAGTIAVVMGEGIHRLDVQSGSTELLYAAPRRRPGTRFNDGKVDPRGRYWAGTMQNNFGPAGEPIAVQRNDGALYRFDADGSVHTIEENLGIANTLAWSPDHQHFYFADSVRGEIYVYDFDLDSGSVNNKRPFLAAGSPGVPDGSAMDVDGCLWNARWDGGVILRITPEGKVDRTITLPVPRPTSCAFGGPRLDTLYVTSATTGLSAAQLQEFPLSGSLFAIDGLGQGLPVPPLSWHHTFNR